MIESKYIKDSEQESLSNALDAICPLTPLSGRVIVMLVKEKDENATIDGMPGQPSYQIPGVTVTEGGILVPKRVIEQKYSETPAVKALIKKVPIDCKIAVHEYDIVYVFPNISETVIEIDGNAFFIYHERDLISKIEL
jgi:co-chaperonin GroES (HSP10)